jgi:hypothetical protein
MAIFEVEIGNKRNDQWLFPGNQQVLRGRWDYNNCSHLDTGERHKSIQQKTSYIPGQLIRIDTDKQTISILDALSETEDGKTIWDKVSGLVGFVGGNANFKTCPPQLIELCDSPEPESTLKNWMYWCARGIRDCECKPTDRSAKWPTCQQVDTMAGYRIVFPYDETKTEIEKRGPVVAAPVGAK